MNEKDKALALRVVREIDAAFKSSERLRLGRWVLPNEREETLASFIVNAFTTVRQEARAAAFRETVEIASRHIEHSGYTLHRWGEEVLDCRNVIWRELEAAANSVPKDSEGEGENHGTTGNDIRRS